MLLLGLPLTAAAAVMLTTSLASGAPYAAEASVTPQVQYLNDTVGTVYTFTIKNTGTTEAIGAVEISRPNNLWAVTGCPSGPVGWSRTGSDTKCRYRSVAGEGDDLQPGQTSNAFQLRATTPPGTHDTEGMFTVVVSKSDHFDNPSLLTLAASAGLNIKIHSFEVTDAVVSDVPVAAGSACPASDKDANRGAVVTMVICGRNRTTTTLTPNATNSSISGTFLAAPGTFSSGPIPSMTLSTPPVVLGSWTGAEVTNAAGPGKTVVVVIGSSTNQTSPSTTLNGYEALNQAPVANDDNATVGEDSAGTNIDVLANDTDADGDPLTVGTVDTTGTVGTVTDNGGDVTYDPNGQFDHLAAGEQETDTFTYTANDGFGDSAPATVTVTITGANDAPVAVDDQASADENGPAVTVDVLANDSDADTTDTLIVTSVDDTDTAGAVTITNGGADVSYDPNGQFESLAAGETGSDTFTYTVSDGNGGSDTATVTVTVTGSNDAPVAVDDAATVSEDAGATAVDVLANDSDPDATDTLTVTAVGATGTVGTVTNNGSDVSYDPNGQFENLAVGETVTDTFTYTIDDGNGGSDTSTVIVTITGANDAPVANDDAAAANENGPAVAIDVRANDTDADATDALTVTAVTTTGTAGVVTITNGGADVSYDPNGAFEHLDDGEADTDTFTYTVSDGNGGTDTATVSITVNGSNDAPVAVDDAAGTNEDAGATVVNVLANDTDVDIETLTVSAINTTGTSGAVTNNGTSVSYNPNGQFNGLGVGETATDTFTYTATDGTASDTATVTITITGVNDAPVAVDDTASVSDSPANNVINVLANDTDADGDTLSVSAIDTAGTQGTATITNGGANVTYNPGSAYSTLPVGQTATDTFSYTVSDGNATDTATVTVTITGANTAPVAANDSFTGAIGNTKFSVGVTTTGEPAVNVSGNLLANDTDGDGDTLTASLVSVQNESEVTVNPDGSFTYVSPAGFTGLDGFTYSVSDGTASDTATALIDVSGMVWYVDDSVDNGNGTSTDPYSSLGPLQGIDLDEPSETIFLYSGSYAGGIVLEANQDLLGEPNGLVVNGHTLVPAGGTNPTIGNASGAGITLASGVDVQRVNVTGTSGDGISGTGVSSAIVGSNTTISNASGAAVKIDGGAGNISVASAITNTAGRSVDIRNRTGGGVSLTGSVNDTGAGVFLNSNTGSTLNLSGGLSLSTGANPAFTATGGGSVMVTGTNSATTTTGTAVTIANTTILSSGVTFASVSSNGAVNGIALTSTGTTGKLTVNGGTIAGSTLNGVNALGPTRLSLANTSVTGSLLDAVRVDASSGTTSVLVENAVLSGPGSDGVDALASGSGTLNLIVRDSDVTNVRAIGLKAVATDSASMKTTLIGNTITNGVSHSINVVGQSISTVNAIVTGNTISHPSPPAAQIGFGIRISQEHDGDYTGRVDGNTISGTGSGGLKVFSTGGAQNTRPGTSSSDTGTLHVSVTNNVVNQSVDPDVAVELLATSAENSLCTVVTGNTASASVADGIPAMWANQESGAAFRIEGLLAGSQNDVVTAAHLNANNTSVPPAFASGTFTGVAAGTCRTPATTPEP
ncbi:MAG TPA: Ig-like domain-containing protein [Acidimicrobiales bacterium]